jgi:hypothetical protein
MVVLIKVLLMIPLQFTLYYCNLCEIMHAFETASLSKADNKEELCHRLECREYGSGDLLC